MSSWIPLGKEVFGLIVIAGLTYYISTVVATVFKLLVSRRRHGDPGNGFLPPVSVLKPVTGEDGNLRENLLSFINQDYPEFEIIIGIQSPTDPALKLVEELKEQYPSTSIKLTVGNHILGYNPKVNNLYGMLPSASHDYMVISDSNVIVDKDYLKANMGYFKNKEVGIVTNLIKGIGGEGTGALFENLHLNSFIIGNVSLLDIFKKTVVVGKSIFFRKSQFDELGGLWELRNYLAEDYLMGRLYKQNGYQVVIAPYLISTTNHSWTIRRFINRHTRWAQLRWNLNKPAYFAELITNFALWTFAYLIASGFTRDAIILGALCWAAKITGDSLMNSLLNTGLQLKHCLAAPLKDLLIGFLWIVPLVNRKTSWRGKQVKIARDTLLLPTN